LSSQQKVTTDWDHQEFAYYFGEGGDVMVWFITAKGINVLDAERACQQAVRDTQDAHQEQHPANDCYEVNTVIEQDGAVMISLNNVATAETATAAVTAIIGRLADAGMRGHLTTNSPAAPAMLRRWDEINEATRIDDLFPAGFLYWKGYTYPHGETKRLVPAWHTDEAFRSELIEWALEWTQQSARPEDRFAGHVQITLRGTAVVLPLTAAAAYLERHLTSSIAPQVHWICDESGQRERTVGFDPRGRMVFNAIDHTTSALDQAALIRDVLIEHAPRIELGFIRTGPQRPDGDVNRTIDSPRYPPQLIGYPHHPKLGGYHQFGRHHDHHQIPDAYPISIVTNAHLANAHDLSAWAITDIGDGKHLLEHPDPHVWFTNEGPDDRTLAVARADFGTMIVTDHRR